MLYRPAVVKATMWMPRWWECELAKLSAALDERWEIGWWTDGIPHGTCEICERRAAWLEFEHAVGCIDVCGWCPAPPFSEARSEDEAFSLARQRSIRWSWQWPKSSEHTL
ncbi:hypothetical protein [Egicoccus halophilus]|uniref:Uncharacterized protein n=1 Tax=Egicoccus halophilus TaxID=1670830 RepID=A0A8J3ETD1_9ACTN|nr:hypothetical protein [Egicoccus halophilus]GGI04961.1 hypothetical protein GCM10011354_11700 [Egicoccus halophilus]